MSGLRDLHISVALFPFRWTFEVARFGGYCVFALGPIDLVFEFPAKSKTQWVFPEYVKHSATPLDSENNNLA